MTFLDSFVTGATIAKKTSGGKWKFKNNGKMVKISKKKWLEVRFENFVIFLLVLAKADHRA